MIEIDNKAISPVAVYFPKNSSTVADSYSLVLHSEVTQLDFTFSGLTNESNTNNYYKLKIDVSQIDDGVYNYQILANEEIVASGLMKVGKVEDDIPEKHSYNPFDENNNNNENEIVQYYPVGNYKHRYQNDKYVEVTEITDNLHIEVTPDEGYDALYKVIVCGNTQAMYDSGVTDGIAEQKAKLIPTAVTENGVYEREDGFNSVTVDVPVDDYWNSGYTSGYTDGYESGTTDGFASGYTSGYTDGYSSGSTDGFESGYTSGYTVGYGDGYESGTTDGFNSGYTSGYTDGYSSGSTDGYSSGYTVGFESGETYGIEEQKAKLVATAVTENGVYSREDGFNEIDVNVPVDDYWNSGYTSGTTDGFASGYTSGYTDGYTSGYTDGFNTGYTSGCTDGYQEGYGDGFTSGETYGVQEQKAKLIATAITHNGTYEREDGFNSITVNVESGQTINNQTKSITATTNGSQVVTYDEGYTGLENVNVNVNVPVDDYFESGYTSGYTAGYASGETDGVAEQKAKLVATAVTVNGTYSREDGYNEIVVNVPSGSSINNQTKSITATTNGSSAITYDAGYTGLERVNVNVNVPDRWNEGYISGETDGVAEQKAKLVATAVTSNGTYQREDGYNEIVVNVPDRWNEGYISGKTDGVAEQKAKLISTAITSNGTYQREDGFNSVTVNVPSGETIEYYHLTVNITSPVPSGLINNAQVTVSYLTSAQTKTYTGNSLEFDILPGVNYTVSFSQVSEYVTPENITGTTNWGGTRIVNANYEPTGLNKYLTFKVKSAGNIAWNLSGTTGAKVIEYSKDNGSTWTSITASTATTIPVVSGDTVMLKGNNDTYSTYPNYSFFNGTTCQFDVEGNIMSLLYGDDFKDKTALQSDSTFTRMFYGCTGLTSAENLELPATKLTNGCYSNMFRDCISLVNAPALPSTTLMASCYGEMFEGCTSLTTAPELPATTLISGCYAFMFNGCSSLNYIKCLATVDIDNCSGWVSGVSSTGTFVKSPEATDWTRGADGIPVGWTVEDYNKYLEEYLTFKVKNDGNIKWSHYNSTPKVIEYSKDSGTTWTSTTGTTTIPVVAGENVIFKGTNPTYSGDTFSGTSCEFDVEGNIMSLLYGDDFEDKTTLVDRCYYGMFGDCTSLTSVGNLVLPATTLANYCYSGMFVGCTSLVTAPVLPATTLATQCYTGMFMDCTSLVNAPALPATTLATQCYQQMFANCTSLITVPNDYLHATTLATGCYYHMFDGCTSLVTAPALPATTLATTCYGAMFSGCTSLTTAPELPALTLISQCYIDMFRGCTNVNYIKCLATDISAYKCTDYWLYDAPSTGTFVKNASMSGWPTGGLYGIPVGWTIIDA